MDNKRKWFIRVTSVDKANGPSQNMVTSHSSYSHASMHLTNVIKAEKNGTSGSYTKGKLKFDIMPMKKQKDTPVIKNTKTESLMEDDDKKPEVRDKTKIVSDAATRAKEKKGLKVTPPTGNKTVVGGEANKIDMDPKLEPNRIGQDGRPVVSPSPSNKTSN